MDSKDSQSGEKGADSNRGITPADAYYFCGITPDQFDRYTPRELSFMVEIAKRKLEDQEMADNARIARLTAHLFALFGAPIEYRDPRKFMPEKESKPAQKGMTAEEMLVFALEHKMKVNKP